jgi:Spy/CpxP family protein refolding chaperone
MKKLSPVRTALLLSVLAFVGAGAALAQDAAPSTATTPANNGGGAPGGGGRQGGWMNGVLTPDEQAELKKDRDAVFAADPDLKKQQDDLMSQRPARDASQDDKDAFRAKAKDVRDKVKAAVLKIDPAAAPIFAKLEAAMAAHRGGGGAGGGGGGGR